MAGKANKMLGLLKRTSLETTDVQVKTSLFVAQVKSLLTYVKVDFHSVRNVVRSIFS